MKKQLIRLTEADLHRVIKESVKRVLKEVTWGGSFKHNDGDKTPHGTMWLHGKEVDPNSPEAQIWRSQQRAKKNYPNGTQGIAGKNIKCG